MTIVAPLQIFIDESGSPDFLEVKEGEPLKAYVPCAVAVPTLETEALLRLLPRGANGALLKSSDLEFSADVAFEFVNRLLSSNAEVAAILIDPAHSTSISAAWNNTALVNMRRKDVHLSKISKAGFSYSIFAARLVTNILMVALNRTGSRPSFFDVVLDKSPLSPMQERQWRAGLKSAAHNHNASVARVMWTDEGHESLLLLPDLVAGILHRDAIRGDVQRARQLLQDAGRIGRISLHDGHKFQLKRASDV